MSRSDTFNLIRAVAQGNKSPVVAQAVERLRTAERDIDLLTPAELHQYIDPNAVERSFEQEQLQQYA